MAAAGSAVITEVLHRSVKKIKWAWTSDASGNVSGGAGLTTAKDLAGKIIGIVTVPAGGGVAPTDLYDLVINDADGVDVLAAAGANRAVATTQTVLSASLGLVCESSLELVVSNAGNAKQGTVYLYIQ